MANDNTTNEETLEALLKKGAPKQLDEALKKATTDAIPKQKSAIDMTLEELLAKGKPKELLESKLPKKEAELPEKIETQITTEEKSVEKIETAIAIEPKELEVQKPKIVEIKKPEKPTIISVLEKKELKEDEDEVMGLLQEEGKKEEQKQQETAKEPTDKKPTIIERIKKLFAGSKDKKPEEIKEILEKQDEEKTTQI